MLAHERFHPILLTTYTQYHVLVGNCIIGCMYCKKYLLLVRTKYWRPFSCTHREYAELAVFGYLEKSSTKWCQIQVNNYEIVVNFLHISHNLTWYSAIVHKFTRIYPVCSTYELTKQFMEKIAQSISKRINLYRRFLKEWQFSRILRLKS